MTARIFKTDEAVKYGIVSREAADPVAEANMVAEEIVARSPDSVALTKKVR